MAVIVCFCKKVSKCQDSVAKISLLLENVKSSLIVIHEKSQADRRQSQSKGHSYKRKNQYEMTIIKGYVDAEIGGRMTSAV